MNSYLVYVYLWSRLAVGQNIWDQLTGVMRDKNMLLQYGLTLGKLIEKTTSKHEPALLAVVEVSESIAQLVRNPKGGLSDHLITATIFSTSDHIKNIVNDFSYQPLLRLLSILSHTLRSSGYKKPSPCSGSHRYKSSSIASLESQWDTVHENPNYFMPVSGAMRDIGISRSRCPEDTLVSTIMITRSLAQLGGTKIVDPLMDHIASTISGLGLHALLGISQPVFDALISLSNVLHGSRGAFESTDSGKPGRVTLSEFDCSNSDCEVERVVKKLESVSPAMQSIDRELRKEFLFLQSVNANWWKPWNDLWGLRITQGLSRISHNIRARDSVGVDAKCDEGYCKIDNSQFLDILLTNSSLVPIGEIAKFGIELLADIDPRCTVAIATGFTLVQLALTRTARSHSVNPDILASDAGMLMEMAWQTIAGDRLNDLLHNEIPLFDLMSLTWSK